MYSIHLPFEVKGHVKIEDDLGQVLLDQQNAVHPQNLARIISRALSNESNFHIYRIAFGNGGTEVDAVSTITFNTPNDGQPPDIQTWESRLYNETYSEIVDDVQPAGILGSDPGSSGPQVASRAGGGARPENDPVSVANVSGPGVRSRELGLTSEVVVVSVLNPTEPSGQLGTGTGASVDSSFTFDEIGLYTGGANANNSAGTVDVDVGDKTSIDTTELLNGMYYNFNITVDGGTQQTIKLKSPKDNPTYGELIEAINDPITNFDWEIDVLNGAKAAITDTTSSVQTFGFFRFTSKTSGSNSSILLSAGSQGTGTSSSPFDLFTKLPGVINPSIAGTDKGVQNLATDPTKEQERLLTHLVFSPVLKASNRTLTITYTLTISVARTQ